MLKPAKDCLDLGVIVKDIDASLAFYRDALGLKYVGSSPLWFGTLHRLNYGKSDLKLIAPNTPPEAGETGLAAALGYRYVTFVISNLRQVCDKLKADGAHFEIEPKEIMPGVTIAMVHDPDGNVVEFVERA